jgi:hypothetical protein
MRVEPYDVRITRTRTNEIPDPPAVGCFGNPYPVKTYGRDECLKRFEGYFTARVETDPAFRQAVLALRGKRLGCLCKPAPCHGDIIKAWLDAHPDD